MADTNFPDTVTKPDTNLKPVLYILFVPFYVHYMNKIAAEINFQLTKSHLRLTWEMWFFMYKECDVLTTVL